MKTPETMNGWCQLTGICGAVHPLLSNSVFYRLSGSAKLASKRAMTDYGSLLPDTFLFDDNRDDFWVFAYGSLMWRPDFDFTERQPARLEGYSRALCIYSWVHRGTEERPGLVFGLDKGGYCDGFAYKVAPEHQRETVSMLRARELVTAVYLEHHGAINLTGDSPKQVNALFYIADQTHEQYAGRLSLEETARFIRQGVGRSGVNRDYVLSTYEHLCEENIRDDWLAALCADLL